MPSNCSNHNDHSSVTLLLAHGGGFCKQIWDPIIRRMQASSLLHQVNVEFVTFDFPYHGENRDESVPAEIDRESLQVVHPANNWIQWTATAIKQQVQLIQETGKKRLLFGIGHSMGAMALWQTEIHYPGTFAGLILFEPIYRLRTPNDLSYNKFLVMVTLKRQANWPSRVAAEEFFQNLKNFASWDRESLAGYVKGAVVEDDPAPTVALACHPHIEAALYCGHPPVITESDLTKAKCRVSFHYGATTKLFNHQYFQEEIVDKHPSVYSLSEPVADAGHLLVMEKPAAVTDHILRDLASMLNVALFSSL